MSSLSDVTKNVRMTSVLFKMVDANAGYLKVKLDLFKHLHPKFERKRIPHAFVDRIDKSVPRVTVWHHSAEPRDAKQWPSGQNCLSYSQTHDRFLYYKNIQCKMKNTFTMLIKYVLLGSKKTKTANTRKQRNGHLTFIERFWYKEYISFTLSCNVWN